MQSLHLIAFAKSALKKPSSIGGREPKAASWCHHHLPHTGPQPIC